MSLRWEASAAKDCSAEAESSSTMLRMAEKGAVGAPEDEELNGGGLEVNGGADRSINRGKISANVEIGDGEPQSFERHVGLSRTGLKS